MINDQIMNIHQKGILLLGFFIVMLCGCSENDEQPIESSKTNADIIMTSQNFCTEGKLWTGIESTEIRKTPFSYKIQGDTIISTYGCKKVYYQNEFDYSDSEWHYYGALFEEGSKVNVIRKDSEEMKLLYDFDLKVGDHFLSNIDIDETVINIDAVELSGTSFRRFAFKEYSQQSHKYYDNTCYVIEGIGGSTSPLEPWLYNFDGRISEVQSCTVNGKVFSLVNDPL